MMNSTAMFIYVAVNISIPLLYAGWVYWFARHLRQRNTRSFFAALTCLILLTAGTWLYIGFGHDAPFIWIPWLLFIVTISLSICWVVKIIGKGEIIAAGVLAAITIACIACVAVVISVMTNNSLFGRLFSEYDWRMYGIGAGVMLMMIVLGSHFAQRYWYENEKRHYLLAIVWTTVSPTVVSVAYYAILQARLQRAFDWCLTLSVLAAIWIGLYLILADETRATLKWVLCLFSLLGIAVMIPVYQTDYTVFLLPYLQHDSNADRYVYQVVHVSDMDYVVVLFCLACVFWIYHKGQLPLRRKILGWRLFPTGAFVLLVILKIETNISAFEEQYQLLSFFDIVATLAQCFLCAGMLWAIIRYKLAHGSFGSARSMTMRTLLLFAVITITILVGFANPVAVGFSIIDSVCERNRSEESYELYNQVVEHIGGDKHLDLYLHLGYFHSMVQHWGGDAARGLFRQVTVDSSTVTDFVRNLGVIPDVDTTRISPEFRHCFRDRNDGDQQGLKQSGHTISQAGFNDQMTQAMVEVTIGHICSQTGHGGIPGQRAYLFKRKYGKWWLVDYYHYGS